MKKLYATAGHIPSVMADPATLDPHAVRCLWVRPVLDRNGAPAFLPSVVFEDGTDCPLTCEMDGLHARQVCQRIAAAFDWPVRDHRPTEDSGKAQAMRVMASLPEGDRTVIDGQGMVSAAGVGRTAALLAHEAGLPFGMAIEHVTSRIAHVMALAEGSGAQPHIIRKAVCEATEAAIEKLNELYRGQERGAGITGITPEQLGVMVADYHKARGSDDDLFQRGLAAAMEAAGDVWERDAELSEGTRSALSERLLDASLRHWFRLTGRKGREASS